VISHGSVVRFPTLFIGLFEFSNLGKLTYIVHTKFFYYEDQKILESKSDKSVDVVGSLFTHYKELY
jgi:hypothetical protein